MLSYSVESTKIVLMGTSSCPRDEANLPGLPAVERNINQLSRLFSNKAIVGLMNDDIELILNPATPFEMISSLEAVCSEVTDTLIVYYAGHGIKSPRESGLFVATLATTLAKCHISGVAFEDIRRIIFDSPAVKKILIFDCCFSGEIIGGMGGEDLSIVQSNIAIEGTYSIASSPRNRLSFSPPHSEYTAFTGEIIKTLENGVAENVEVITLDRLYQEVERRVRLVPDSPPPQRQINSSIDRFGFAKNVYWYNNSREAFEAREKEYKSIIETLRQQLDLVKISRTQIEVDKLSSEDVSSDVLSNEAALNLKLNEAQSALADSEVVSATIAVENSELRAKLSKLSIEANKYSREIESLRVRLAETDQKKASDLSYARQLEEKARKLSVENDELRESRAELGRNILTNSGEGELVAADSTERSLVGWVARAFLFIIPTIVSVAIVVTINLIPFESTNEREDLLVSVTAAAFISITILSAALFDKLRKTFGPTMYSIFWVQVLSVDLLWVIILKR